MEEGQNNQEEVLGREEERNQENVDIAENGPEGELPPTEDPLSNAENGV